MKVYTSIILLEQDRFDSILKIVAKSFIKHF